MEAGILFGIFAVLLVLGMGIPFAIGIAALLSLLLHGGPGALRAIGLISWGGMANFTLTAVPLFLLMAEIIVASGLSHRIYRGLSALVRHLPGGLLQTNIAGCGLFAAISGSSIATAAAIGVVALPELRRRRYDLRLSLGTLAAGGTLGILIPPSVAMIIYGAFTQTSIVQLFMAGVIPGILLMAMFMAYVAVRALLDPDGTREPGAQAADPTDAGERTGGRAVAADLLPFGVLIVAVIGSLYVGWTTPTESGAIGAVGALAIALIWGELGAGRLWQALIRTCQTTGAVMFIIYAAFLFSYAMNLTGTPRALADWLIGLELTRLQFLLAVFAVYVLLGCVMDSLAMIVITVPILFPVVLQFGIDPVWFGVVLVVLIEIGQITPPLGLNLFVIQGISGAPLSTVVRGAAPFFVIMLLMLALLTIWPGIALWLASTA